MKQPRYLEDTDKRFYEARDGFRFNGPKKSRLINLANLELAELGSEGVNVRLLLKILKITGDAFTYSTKHWTGVISKLKQFRRDNHV